MAGTTDAWLEELNAVVRAAREKPATAPRGGYSSYSRFGQSLQFALMSMSRGSNSSSMNQVFQVPTIDALAVRSLPPELLGQLFAPEENQGRGAAGPLSLADLVKRSEKIESPLLRACLAVKSGDAAAIRKAMAAVPPREEAADFEILRSIVLIQEKKPIQAFEALARARAAGTADREFTKWINFSMLAVAGLMTPEERGRTGDQIQATLLQCRQAAGQAAAPVLAMQARVLGLEDLAKRLQPAGAAAAASSGAAATGPAAMAAARNASSSRSSGGSIEKVRKFAAEKKHDAAAREVLLGIRGQNSQMQSYYIRNQLPELVTALGKEGQEALIRLLDPGDSKSLVRRLEFVDVCNAIGKPEKTREVLEALAVERPDDAGVAARLIFVLPAGQDDRWIRLMTTACKSDELVNQAGNHLSTASNRAGDNKQRQDFFERVARWLEEAKPEDLSGANLSWITYHGKRFFAAGMTNGLPSMLAREGDEDEKVSKDPKGEIARQKTVCERLARAMIRHSSCAEEGFRLLTASKEWKIEVAEKDELARQTILTTAAVTNTVPNEQIRRYGGVNYFQFQSNNGSTSDGEDLADWSSVGWLLKRMEEEKQTARVFPPEFITALKRDNPKTGELMTVLTRELKASDLEELWNSEVMTRPSDRLATMLRPLLLQRFVATPGSTKFFVDRIARIAPGQAAMPDNFGNNGQLQVMFHSALSGAAMGKPGELDAVAKAIRTAVFGEKVEFSETKPRMVSYQQLGFLESLLQQTSIDALAMVRIQAAFFRLGVPMDDDEYGAIRPFQSKRFAKAAEAEAYFESLGWLSEVDRWEPYASMLYQRGNQGAGGNNGNSYPITLKPTLMLERVLQYAGNGGMDRKDLVKLLKERKKGRFGSLMIAAAMSSGKERSDLAGLAFQESSAALAKLPPERLASLALVLPWLSEEAKAKLPEKLRARIKGQDERQRESALAQADQFLEALRSTPFDNMMGRVDEAIKAVWPYDSDKAAVMMIASEQAYTDSLARGGGFSNATTGEWEIPNRDYIFGQILESRGSEGSSLEPEKLFAFVAKLLESPAGKRMAFNDATYNKTSLFSKMALPLLKDGKQREGGDRIVQLVEVFQARKGKGPASVVFPAFLLADLQLSNGAAPDEKRKLAVQAQLDKLTAKDPQAAKLATMKLALWAWAQLTPEEKAETRRIYAALLTDAAIPDVARLALAGEWLATVPAAERFDAASCGALAKLYQEYASAGRSAITFASESIFSALASAAGQEDSVARMNSELARIFWENAGTANVAGHPPIPSVLAQSTFITAVFGGEKELIAKTFPRIKTGTTGKLGAMIALLQAGQFDFARQIAPAPGELFQAGERGIKYTRELEKAITAFKDSGAEPLTLQKLGIEMLGLTRAEGGEAPEESREAQVERLVAAFAAAPPDGPVFSWALGSLLSRLPGDPRLAPLLMAWAKEEPVAGFIVTSNRSSANAEERARQTAVELHGMAAVHALALGDPAPMKAIREAVDVPINPDNGSNYYLCRDLIRMNAAMSRMVWGDVCAGSTAGYATGAAEFNAFVLAFANQIASYDPSGIEKPLALANFLAGWTADPAPFAALCEGLPDRCLESGKRFAKEPGFIPFLKTLTEAGSLKTLSATAGKAVFLGKVLPVPGFAGSYPRQVGWVDNLRKSGFKDEIDAIVLAPPAGTVREALPEILEQGGQLRLDQKNLEEAAKAFRNGLEVCPESPAFNHTRGVLKWKLADVLNSQDQREEARKMFDTIAPDEIAGWLKDRHAALAKKLDAKP